MTKKWVLSGSLPGLRPPLRPDPGRYGGIVKERARFVVHLFFSFSIKSGSFGLFWFLVVAFPPLRLLLCRWRCSSLGIRTRTVPRWHKMTIQSRERNYGPRAQS